MSAHTLSSGTKVTSANGNPGTVVGNMNASGSLVAIKLDNGRQVTCLADLCTVIESQSIFSELDEIENCQWFIAFGKAVTDVLDVATVRMLSGRKAARWLDMADDLIELRDELNALAGC